jgi:hypothetical protein
MWDLKPFRIYTLCSQEKRLCLFNVGFETQETKLFFQCGI